jgi:ABC-type dipeptide/oligopeptide/nickel transport system permease component
MLAALGASAEFRAWATQISSRFVRFAFDLMFTYIIRRLLLMIPTLFGVTLISFCIMQLAPGDPLLNQLSGGSAGQSTGTREGYLVQKRDLNLDKPIVLNVRYFKDYSTAMHWAAYFRARSIDQIKAEISALRNPGDDAELNSKLTFLESLGIPEFNERLNDPERQKQLAELIDYFVLVYCEDTGLNAVPSTIAILQDPKSIEQLRIGAIRCLRAMVVDPFVFTYSVHPSEEETPAVVGAWQLWWNQHKKNLPELDDEARMWLGKKLAVMAASRDKVFATVDEILNSDYADIAPRYFADNLLNPKTPLDERFAAAVYLKQVFAEPLRLDVPIDAKPPEVQEATANWLEYYRLHETEFEPSALKKLWYVVADTQYAHMIARLATFDFGRSALRTREKVSGKIWDAVVVSAPLMLMSELFIYLVAVPLGIVCGVRRGGITDRSISLMLFLLYSIPPFVAGMLFLVFLCYGSYLKIFPMLGLHSDGSETWGFLPYLGDYLSHAFLPVVCLSLFSLAAIAMYSRSAILDVINQDYIRTARAKGLSGPVVVLKHALRNGLIPILTLFSTFLPAMLGGSVLIEYIFDIPGMGRLGLISVEQKDVPTLMALLYLEAIVTLVSFLITDLLYILVDPRISFEGRGSSA